MKISFQKLKLFSVFSGLPIFKTTFTIMLLSGDMLESGPLHIPVLKIMLIKLYQKIQLQDSAFGEITRLRLQVTVSSWIILLKINYLPLKNLHLR